MELFGYFAASIIGVSLGLIGGGGSILTVPVLVYLFGVDPVLATSYSLFIVGSTALVGAFPKWQNNFVNVKTAFIFGIPSIAAVYMTRKWLVPLIPQEVFSIGGLTVTKPILLLLLFALLMIAASISMIRDKSGSGSEAEVSNSADAITPAVQYLFILLEGAVVGVLTGLVGAGGGFLIIPALVLFAKLPMKEAVGTSLLIIGMKSLLGFTGDIGHYEMDWHLLFTVTGLAIAGIFAGNALSRRIAGERLKVWFGWFVLFMGVYIIIRELS